MSSVLIALAVGGGAYVLTRGAQLKPAAPAPKPAAPVPENPSTGSQATPTGDMVRDPVTSGYGSSYTKPAGTTTDPTKPAGTTTTVRSTTTTDSLQACSTTKCPTTYSRPTSIDEPSPRTTSYALQQLGSGGASLYW